MSLFFHRDAHESIKSNQRNKCTTNGNQYLFSQIIVSVLQQQPTYFVKKKQKKQTNIYNNLHTEYWIVKTTELLVRPIYTTELNP